MISNWFRRRQKAYVQGGSASFLIWSLLLACGLSAVPAMAQDPCTGKWTFSPTTVTLDLSNQWKIPTLSVTPPAGCTALWLPQAANGGGAGNCFVSASNPRTYWLSGPNPIYVGGYPNPPTSPCVGTVQIVNPAYTVLASFPVTDVSSPPLGLTCASSTGQVGVRYSSSFVASGGDPQYSQGIPYSYSIPGGSVDYILLNSNGGPGSFIGTPYAPGTFNFVVTVTDPTGKTASFPCSITIKDKNQGPTLTCPANSGTVGVTYSSSLAATGTPPYMFSIASGALPAGLALNSSTGAISGTPTTAGTASFTARLADSSGSPPATAPCSIAIQSCDFSITGPADVPGLSQYVYQLPTGSSATGVSWSVDKATASVTPLSPIQATVAFANTNPDWITLKADFTLDGNKECALTHIALVRVEVGAAKFDTPGKATHSGGALYNFVDNPPAAPAVQTWVTTNDPGSDWAKFTYNGTEQRAERSQFVRSSATTAPSFQAESTVTLTSPAEKADAFPRIQIGFIQSSSIAGYALYPTAPGTAGPKYRLITVPTLNTVDWLSSASHRALGDTKPWAPGASDEWPWYDTSARQTGGDDPVVDGEHPCSVLSTTSWSCKINMNDAPSKLFPAQYNPADRSDPGWWFPIEKGRMTSSFTVRIGARTLDSDLGADKHYFDEADAKWTVNYVWPVVEGASIVTPDQGWSTPSAPSEVNVNVVASSRNHNSPYLQWIPQTIP